MLSLCVVVFDGVDCCFTRLNSNGLLRPVAVLGQDYFTLDVIVMTCSGALARRRVFGRTMLAVLPLLDVRLSWRGSGGIESNRVTGLRQMGNTFEWNPGFQ